MVLVLLGRVGVKGGVGGLDEGCYHGLSCVCG